MWYLLAGFIVLVLLSHRGHAAPPARPANRADAYTDSIGRAPGWSPDATRAGYYAIEGGIAEVTYGGAGDYAHSTGRITLVDGTHLYGNWDSDGTNSTPGNPAYNLGRYLGQYDNIGPARDYKRRLGIH